MGQAVDYAFLHGAGEGGWLWDDLIAAMRLQTDGAFGGALALDVPGCGEKAGRDVEPLGPDEVAAELIGDIEAAGFKDVVLVGHSMAGTILPRMVAQRPDLFRRLIYVACAAPAPGQTASEIFGTSRRGENPDEIGWPIDPRTCSAEELFKVLFWTDTTPAQTEMFRRRLHENRWPAPTQAARDWTYDHLDATPSTYVVCLQDMSAPARWQEVFAERLRCQRLVRIDAGHQAMVTRPHALAEALRIEAALQEPRE